MTTLNQLLREFDEWHALGETLAAAEQDGVSIPDPDDYAAYDDEAARILLALVPIVRERLA